MKKIIIVLLAVFVSFPAFGLREYYSLTKSIRALGMGGAFYGLSDDEYALFYNPAGLSNYRGEGKFMFSLGAQSGTSTYPAIKKVLDLKDAQVEDIVNSLSEFQGKPIYAGAGVFPYYVRKNFAVGLLIADVKAQLAVLGRDLNTSLDVTAISDSGLVIGYGRSLFDKNLHLGVNVKGVFRAGGKKTFSVLEIAQNQDFTINPKDLGGAGAGVDFDLGAMYDIEGLPFGVLNQISIVMNNVLASQLTLGRTGGMPPTLPRMISLSAHSVLPGYGAIENFHLLIDFAEFRVGGETDPDFGARTGSFFKHVNLGIEAPMKWFLMRAGLHQGQFTAGIGLRTSFLQLDVATYSEELASGVGRLNSRRIAARLALGFGNAPPPPIAPKSILSEGDQGSSKDSVEVDLVEEKLKEQNGKKANDEFEIPKDTNPSSGREKKSDPAPSKNPN